MTQTPSSTTAGAGSGQTATPAEITAAIIKDTTPRADGMSNRERVATVLATFGAETIDFDEVFDYGVALVCGDPYIVNAWKHLAILQGVYAETLYIYQWIDEDDYYRISDYLRCVILNLDHHIRCLYAGTYTPLYIIPEHDLH